jgi:hypothetical protein
MNVSNLSLRDYASIPVALGPNFDSAFVPATVSFDVVWSGPITRRVDVSNGTNGDQFAGTYVENNVTITWSGTNANGLSFESNPGDFSTSGPPFGAFAEIGHEQNGSFFESDSPAGQQGGNDGALVDQAFSVLASPAARTLANALAAGSAQGGNPLRATGHRNDLAAAQRMAQRNEHASLTSNFAASRPANVLAATDRVFELFPDPVNPVSALQLAW